MPRQAAGADARNRPIATPGATRAEPAPEATFWPNGFAALGGAAPQQLLDALGEAGLHAVQQNLDLARELAGCSTPGEAMACSMRWSAARMDQLLADQARVMAAFLALVAPADQRGAEPGRD